MGEFLQPGEEGASTQDQIPLGPGFQAGCQWLGKVLCDQAEDQIWGRRPRSSSSCSECGGWGRMCDQAGEAGRRKGQVQAPSNRKQTDATSSGAAGPKWPPGSVGARVPLHRRADHWRRGGCREVVESCCDSGSTGMICDHENTRTTYKQLIYSMDKWLTWFK